MLGHRSDACREFAGFSFFVWGFNGESLAFRRQVLKLRLPGLSTRAGSRVIRTATNSDYRVHSYALDNYCGTSAPVSEGLLRHHLRTARLRQAEAKNHVPHVDVPIPPPLPPCDYLAAVRQAVRWATHTNTPPMYVYGPSTYSTADATASELGERRRSRPLTCSNSGTLPRVSGTLPQHQKDGATGAALAAARTDLCVRCEVDSRVRTRRLCGRGGAQP